MARFYLTTAIDYVNSRPHLGTAYEKVTADVIARYKRLCGIETRFLMGNDEHSQNVFQRAKDEGRTDVEVVLAPFDDPALPEPVDLIFTCNTYHHLADRRAYFDRAARYLKPGGRIAIVEFSGEGFFGWLFGHSTPPQEIEREMADAGYRTAASHDFLSRQSFLVFERVSSAAR